MVAVASFAIDYTVAVVVAVVSVVVVVIVEHF